MRKVIKIITLLSYELVNTGDSSVFVPTETDSWGGNIGDLAIELARQGITFCHTQWSRSRDECYIGHKNDKFYFLTASEDILDEPVSEQMICNLMICNLKMQGCKFHDEWTHEVKGLEFYTVKGKENDFAIYIINIENCQIPYKYYAKLKINGNWGITIITTLALQYGFTKKSEELFDRVDTNPRCDLDIFQRDSLTIILIQMGQDAEESTEPVKPFFVENMLFFYQHTRFKRNIISETIDREIKKENQHNFKILSCLRSFLPDKDIESKEHKDRMSIGG